MKITKSTVAAALTAGGLFVATGAGALTLPDHAGSTADDKVPSAVSNPPDDAQDNATAVRQDDADATTAAVDDDAEAKDTESSTESTDDEAGRPEDTHGAAVSALATSTDLEGREKGEAISTLARTNAGGDDADEADEADDHSSDAGEHAADDADGADNATSHGKSAEHRGQDD